MKKTSKGFTLVELIVVIAIIGVLAAILVPSMSSYVQSSKFSSADSNAKTAYNAAAAWVTQRDIDGEAVGVKYTCTNGTASGVTAARVSGDTTTGDLGTSDLFGEIADKTGTDNPCFVIYFNNSGDGVEQVWFAKNDGDKYVGGHPEGNPGDGDANKGTMASVLSNLGIDGWGANAGC